MESPLSSNTLCTQRLRLEPFGEHHLDGLNAMNSLPEVMRYVGGQTETREQTASVIARVKNDFVGGHVRFSSRHLWPDGAEEADVQVGVFHGYLVKAA